MTEAETPTIIVVTPVKDDAWILDTFLAAATTWADHVIVADQQSTDGSPEIAARYDRVRVVLNDSAEYDEGHRQRLLLREARKLPGPRIIFALDADEVLSANALDSDFLDRVRRLPPGTGIWMRWAQLLPGLRQAWVTESDWKCFGFVDDGSEHGGQRLHSTRLPVDVNNLALRSEHVFVLHLNYAAAERSWAKLRWYQCWERLNNPEQRPIRIFRQYQHILGIAPDELRPADPAWTAGYSRYDVELRVPDATATRHDAEVLGWLDRFGPDRFARIDIWQVDWQAKARALGRDMPAAKVADPRSAAERIVMRWLARTQPHAGRPSVRLAQRMLRPLGW
jgi:glycosyl transferase family 2